MAIEVFKLFGSIMVDNDKANESIKKTDKNAESLGSKFVKGVGTAGKWGMAIAGAAAAGGAALFGMANKAAATTDRIDKMSQKIGLSREGFQEWEFILSQSGTDIEKMQAGLKTLTGRMEEATKGTGAGAESFEKLKLSATDSTGALKSQELMFEETVTALQNMEDGTEKSRLATQLFGKAGLELMPLLNGAAGSVEELKTKAGELGLVLSDDAIDAGVMFTDTMDQLKRGFQSVVTQIGVNVMPIVQKFSEWIMSNMPTIQAVISGFFDGVEWFVTNTVSVCTGLFGEFNLSWDTVMQALKSLWETYGAPIFEAIGPLIQAVYDNWSIIWDSVKLYWQTMWEIMMGAWESIGKPIFDLVIGLVGLVADFFAERMPAITGFFSQMVTDISAFWENNLKPCFDAIGNFITNVLAPAFTLIFNHIIAPAVDTAFKLISDLWNNFLKPVFTGITDFLTGVFSGNFTQAFSGIVSAIKGIFGGLVSVVKTPLNLVIGVVNSFINGLNKLKIPDWVPVVGGKGINIPDIPMLAKGTDYFSGGHAIVGEQGPELVTMPKGSKVTPNRETESMLGGNGGTFILQTVLDGNVVAQTIAPYSDIVGGQRLNLSERGVLV